MATRRTHIVRIFDRSSGTKNPNRFVDVEVLDAISFREPNNREVILDFNQSNVEPVIKDTIGSGSAKNPGAGTRLSHMKRVTSSNGRRFYAIEVLDCIAFRDANGAEWILNMPSAASVPFNKTDGTGGETSTRRTHNEKVGKGPNPKNFIKVERCDMLSFRSQNGRELIIDMASTDDGTPPGRASSFTTPFGYTGTDSGPTPPENSDKNVYFKFLSGSAGVATNNDALVSMGPLWWLRRVKTGGDQWFGFKLHANAASDALVNFSVTFDTTDGDPGYSPITGGILTPDPTFNGPYTVTDDGLDNPYPTGAGGAVTGFSVNCSSSAGSCVDTLLKMDEFFGSTFRITITYNSPTNAGSTGFLYVMDTDTMIAGTFIPADPVILTANATNVQNLSFDLPGSQTFEINTATLTITPV
jgi:hypothetical protein